MRVEAEVFIYPGIDNTLLQEAMKEGENAKISYYTSLMGVGDERKRRNLYLDGLERCDHMWNEQSQRLTARVERESKSYDAAELEKIGLKPFQSQFMTIPVGLMKEVVNMACSKHEQQLQCGSVFEGRETILKRIQDLHTIGNHRLMFEYECKDPTYTPRVYPCLGRSLLPMLRIACGHLMDEYWRVREANNAQISKIYETSLHSVKKLKAVDVSNQSILEQFIFNSAMKKIVNLEGEKCGLFKKMRSCVLPVIKHQCGSETHYAINISITVGYLRTERKERLQLDFENFEIPAHPNCIGL
uniref:Uncharacterized protein n=1 Tax=Acrobeloides nanus TaxID=290746 RepID=A0A914BVW4_9BILA